MMDSSTVHFTEITWTLPRPSHFLLLGRGIILPLSNEISHRVLLESTAPLDCRYILVVVSLQSTRFIIQD